MQENKVTQIRIKPGIIIKTNQMKQIKGNERRKDMPFESKENHHDYKILEVI